MAGSWPEDEYDVAESPLSYVDYKSQVFFDFDGPVAPVVNTGVEDSDFDSLESESGWGGDVDDTLATEVDIEAPESPNTDLDVVSGVEGGMLDRLFEEIDKAKQEIQKGAKEREMEEQRQAEEEEGEGEEGIEIKSGSESDAVLREEILEGPEEAISSEIESTIATRAEGELRGEIEEIFRTEIAAEVDRAFNSMTENEVKTEDPTLDKAQSETPEAIGDTEKVTDSVPTGPIISAPQIGKIIPIVGDSIEPPPIPSRSPSRPGTSMANRKILNETPATFAPQQRSDSSLSLPPAKVTASSISSPRSSRFFEDLGDPVAATVTSTEASEKNPLSPPLPPPRKESNASNAKSSLKKKSKKRRSFFQVCGLQSFFKKMKLGVSKGSSSREHPRTTSISSLIKKW